MNHRQYNIHRAPPAALLPSNDPFSIKAAVTRSAQESSKIHKFLGNGLLYSVWFLSVLPFILLVALPICTRLFERSSPRFQILSTSSIFLWIWFVFFLVDIFRLFSKKSTASNQENLFKKDDTKRKKVIVIGSGPVGLAAVKECIEKDLDVVAYERASSLGGVFRFSKHTKGGVWKSCRLVSSPYVTAFSDFPPPCGSHNHMKHEEYIDYLVQYAEHYNLCPHIHFGHTVTNVMIHTESQTTDETSCGKWIVKVTPNEVDSKGLESESKNEIQEIADYVIVCSRLNQTQQSSKIRGAENFSGKLRCANEYKGPEEYQDKKVVVVGNGESAVDIANDLSSASDRILLSIRCGSIIIPRMEKNGKIPRDYNTVRFRYASPVALNNWYLFLRRRVDILRGKQCKNEAVMTQLLETSQAGPLNQTATKNDEFIRPLLNGKLSIVPQIFSLDRSSANLIDGSKVSHIDAVILAYGYNPIFPFLKLPTECFSDDMKDSEGNISVHPMNMYMRMFIPQIGPSLSFLGFARPAIGAIPPIGELQARYVSQLASGERSLPSFDEMMKSVNDQVDTSVEEFPTIKLPNVIVSFIRYMDLVADKVGCRPCPWTLLKDPALFWRVASGPFSGAIYRLHGDGSKPVARETVMKLKGSFTSVQLLVFLGQHFWIWPLSKICEHKAWKMHNTVI